MEFARKFRKLVLFLIMKSKNVKYVIISKLLFLENAINVLVKKWGFSTVLQIVPILNFKFRNQNMKLLVFLEKNNILLLF